LLGGEVARVELCAVENMAPAVMILPRHHLLEWQELGGVSAQTWFEHIMNG
jgi:hypothetical protein